MRLNSKDGVKEAAYDGADAGEGLAVFFSQNGNSNSRWRFLVKAITSQGVYDVGVFYSSPPPATSPPGRLSRMIAGAVCPGALSWIVQASNVKQQEIVPDTAEIILTSSKCFTAPIGVTRVNERYAYNANSGTQNFTVLAGMKITGVAAVGLAGGGTIVVAGGATITVPDGIGTNLEPLASLPPNSVIAFVNVDWVVEYLESA